MPLQDTLTSFIESVKQKELLTSVLSIVKEELPEVYAALIGTLHVWLHDYMYVVVVIKYACLTSVRQYLVSDDIMT